MTSAKRKVIWEVEEFISFWSKQLYVVLWLWSSLQYVITVDCTCAFVAAIKQFWYQITKFSCSQKQAFRLFRSHCIIRIVLKLIFLGKKQTKTSAYICLKVSERFWRFNDRLENQTCTKRPTTCTKILNRKHFWFNTNHVHLCYYFSWQT